MIIDIVPIWVIFLVTITVVMASIEIGHRLGHHSHRRSEDEKESPVSAMASTVLGLTAFMLAFTFGIVTARYDHKKELVREDANAIRTAFLRSDFLPQELDRKEARALIKQYLDQRLGLAQVKKIDRETVLKEMAKALQIQNQLWDMAVANARKDMNSDIGGLYLEALNEVFTVHALRVAVAIQTRIPYEIWLMLYSITILGMVGVGYQSGIAASKRSMVGPLLALSFALVFTLIFALDRPNSGIVKVTQQPLIDLQNWMSLRNQTQ